MQKFIQKHKSIWQPEFIWLVVTGAVLFIISLLVNYFATTYASERVSLPVTDIILSNIRVYDVDGIIIYGPILLIVFGCIVTLADPKRIPFVLKCLGLFIITRSIFISLTHLGPFTPQVVIDPARWINFLGIGTTADLFFSGHTGMPFLLSLIYWDNKYLRYIFLATSIIFATSVLLGHLHYSIDVFAAFFITHTIYYISQKLFRRDWQLLNS